MLAVLIEITAYDPVAAATVTLYASNVDDPAVCMLNGLTWWPAVSKVGTLKYDLFDGSFAGTITSPSSSVSIQTAPWPNFGRYSFADARFRMWTGQVGDAWGAYTNRFDGRVTAQPTLQDGVASVTFATDDKWLDRSLLSVYAGTTGIEGPAALKGTVKPLALGAPRYVPGVLIDTINNVFQISAYGAIQSIEASLERLLRFGAPIGDYANYTALVAAAIPAGRWGTCLAQGLVRFGAPTTGQICFLAQGDNAGSDGWARKPGQLIRYLAKLAGGAGKIDDASLNALDAARPYNVSIYLNDQSTARTVIQAIAASVNAVANVSWLGKLFVVPIPAPGGAASITLAADGSALPPVTVVQQLDVAAPFSNLSLTAERTYTVHQLGDIAFTATLIDMGAYAAGTTYREGNIVQDQGSSWLYINPTPSAGNAPPTLPTTSNAYWKALARAGADAIVGFLTNEATTLPADAAGNVSSYATATGNFRVFAGTSDVSALFALSTQANPQALTVGYSSQTYTVTSGLDAGEDSASLTIRATGSGAYAGLTIDKVFVIGKSKTGTSGSPGSPGANAKLLTVTSDRQTIAYDGTGAATPTTQTTTFTANKQNTTATVTWSVTDAAGVARTPTTTYLSASTGDSVTMTEAQFAAARNGTSGVIVTGTLTDVVVLTDKISIVRVAGGAAGAAGANTATVFLYQRNSTGTAPSVPAGTTTYTFANGVLSGTITGWTQTAPDPANGPFLFVTTAIATATTATDTIATGEWSTVRLLAQDGSFIEYRFLRQAGPPSTPSGASPSGWTTQPPSGTLTLWFVTALKDAAGNMLGGWSTPQSLSATTPRGPYAGGTTYYPGDLVTYNGGTYLCLVQTTGNAPSGTDQSNTWWAVWAAPGAAGTPATPPTPPTGTIGIGATAGTVNLRSLANAAGYTGASNATYTFNVTGSVTGLSSGGIGIDTGSWPAGYTISLTLNIASGVSVSGGGGRGGSGGGSGLNGGDGIYVQQDITIVNSGAIQGGGGGGGSNAMASPYKLGTGGGGGGSPSGEGGAGSEGSITTGTDGSPNGGSGGTPGGGAGGALAAAGSASSGGTPGGAPGNAIRKNGHTVSLSGSGTLTGANS